MILTFDAASIGRVLDEARVEICALEARNGKIEDALADLHMWLTGDTKRDSEVTESSARRNVSMGMQTSVHEETNVTDVMAENQALKLQLDKLKEMSKKLTEKLMKKDNELNADTSAIVTRLSTSAQAIHDMNRDKQSIESMLDNSHVDDVQRQLCDALEKNARWQTYNNEREHYVSNLLSKYNQTSTQLQMVRDKLAHVTSNPDKLATEQRRHFDKLLVDAREKLEAERSAALRQSTELSIMMKKYEGDNVALRKDVEHWRQRYEEQRATAATVSANYESERRRSNNSVVENKEKKSQIKILQRQVQLFSEDFRAERKEKELLASELDFMKQRVEQLQLKLDLANKKPRVSFSDLISDDVMQHRAAVVDMRHPASPPKRMPRLKEPNRETVRSAAASTERKNTKSRSTEQSAPKRVKSRDARKTNRKRISENDALLQCPSCGKEYDIMEHMLLIAHIDRCGD
uniref:TSG101 and ALIX binding domain-containing protein n=2 Tax=Ciona savignyi TaxID=51511 RepID=H2ZLA7_CIOSA